MTKHKTLDSYSETPHTVKRRNNGFQGTNKSYLLKADICYVYSNMTTLIARVLTWCIMRAKTEKKTRNIKEMEGNWQKNEAGKGICICSVLKKEKKINIKGGMTKYKIAKRVIHTYNSRPHLLRARACMRVPSRYIFLTRTDEKKTTEKKIASASWSRTIKNPVLGHSVSCSLAQLPHSLTPQCFPRSCVPLRSFIWLLARSLNPELVGQWIIDAGKSGCSGP